MPTFAHKKIVRDNIWSWHEKAGHTVQGKKLSGKQLTNALCKKLHEEADEVGTARTRQELCEEIADIRQILDDICEIEGITMEDIAITQNEKKRKKGGFLKGCFIEHVLIPDETDEWVLYCRKNPEKYPEIEE